MKYFYGFLVCFFSFLSGNFTAYAQEECSDIPKKITTNPESPFNEQRPERTNTFFDWRKPSFMINSAYSSNPNGEDEEPSPFFDAHALPDMIGMFDNQDMLPEDGWELLDVQLGYLKEGNGTTPNPVKDKENIYFILYNRYTGLMRIFVASTKKNKDYNGAKIRVSLEYAPATSYNKTSPSTLDHAMGEFRALDAYQQKGKGPTVTSFSQYGIQNFKWFRADIITTYDPCVCKQVSRFVIEVSLLEKTTIEITGSINQKVVIDGQNGISTPQNLFKRISFFAENVGNVVGKFTSTYESTENLINEQKNNLAKIPALKFISDLIGKNKKLFEAIPVIGGAVTALDFIVGGGFKKKQTVKPPVSTTDYTVNLQGSIDFVAHLQSSYLFNPGSYHWTNPNINPSVKDAHYPLYNKKLGTFNLMTTPNVKQYDRTDVVTTYHYFSIPGQQANQLIPLHTSINHHVVELTNIEYVVNPDAGFKLPPTYGAPDIYASIIIETEEEMGVDSPGVLKYEYDRRGVGRWVARKTKGGAVNPEMHNFVYVDATNPFTFSTKPLPLHILKNKKIAFNTKGNFKVFLKIMAKLEPEDADENTQNTIFMGKYPVKIEQVGTFSNQVLIDQKNTYQEFGIPNTLNLVGDLTGTPMSIIEPYFQGYRAWENIVIGNKFVQNGTYWGYEKTTVGGAGFSPSNSGYQIVAGKSIKIEPSQFTEPTSGVFFMSYEPIEINPGMSIEVKSPLNYSQNTLPPVSHQEVMYFCDRTYLTNRVFTSKPSDEESPAEAPTNKLLTAYPNPAQEQVTIVYQLAQTSEVEIYLTNAMGQRVATIAQIKEQAEGKHEVLFDTSRLPKGLYLYTLQTANYKETKRLVIK